MQKEFTKADLKDGMVVEYEDKSRRLVINGFLLGKGSHFDLSGYDENLKNSYSRMNIAKVFKIRKRTTLKEIFDDENLELIWERIEPKHMTAEEMRKKLEELTGEKIETELSKEEMVGTIEIYCCNHGCHNCSIRKECDSKDTGFVKSDLEFIKQCYEKVMEDGLQERNHQSDQ